MERIGDILKRQGHIPSKNSVPVSPGPSTTETYQCAACRDSGWVYPLVDGKVNYSEVVRCTCKLQEEQQEREAAMLRFCELPPGCDWMTFEKFKVKKGLAAAFEAAKAVAEETGPTKWLVLVAPVDTGKTHLAVAICRRWLERGRPARYAYVPELLDELRDGLNDETYERRFHSFLNVPLLVLDDLGVEKPSDWVSEKLTTIINHRAMQGSYLVVTTNKALDDLPGDDLHRIGSRLRRYDFCQVLALDVPEHSAKGRQNEIHRSID